MGQDVLYLTLKPPSQARGIAIAEDLLRGPPAMAAESPPSRGCPDPQLASALAAGAAAGSRGGAARQAAAAAAAAAFERGAWLRPADAPALLGLLRVATRDAADPAKAAHTLSVAIEALPQAARAAARTATLLPLLRAHPSAAADALALSAARAAALREELSAWRTCPLPLQQAVCELAAGARRHVQ